MAKKKPTKAKPKLKIAHPTGRPATAPVKREIRKLSKDKPPIDKTPKRLGNPNLQLPLEQRKVCGARTSKAGRCDRCGFVPTPNADGLYARHYGKCQVDGCGGTMRCMNACVRKNGRCKFHGGNVPRGALHGQFKNGRHVNYRTHGYGALLPKGLAKAYEAISQQPDRLSVQKELDLLETFICDTVARMKGGKLWDRVYTLYVALQSAKEKIEKPKTQAAGLATLDKALGKLKKIVKFGKNDVDLRQELSRMMEDKSRIAAREARRQLEQNLHMSIEESAALISSIGQIVLEEIDPMPHAVAEAVRSLPNLDNEPLTPTKIEEIGNEILLVTKKKIAQRVQMLLADKKEAKTLAKHREESAPEPEAQS